MRGRDKLLQPVKGKPILRNLSLRLDPDDRIALLGANGNGKSTLVKLIAGKLAPFSGQLTRADKLSIGYFAQHQVDELDLEGSTYDHIRRLMGDAPESKIRARAPSTARICIPSGLKATRWMKPLLLSVRAEVKKG
mgnify:CR=1 FL=1